MHLQNGTTAIEESRANDGERKNLDFMPPVERHVPNTSKGMIVPKNTTNTHGDAVGTQSRKLSYL